MRIFVGIKASKDLQSKIVKWQRDSNLDVRFIPPENLHITLVPPWNANEDEVKEVVKRLNKIQFNKFGITFNSISYGPNKRRPRLIWITGSPSNELNSLKDNICEYLDKDRKKRKFIPHITIAKYNPKRHKQLEKISQKYSWKETVSRFSLIKSKLKSTGTTYQELSKHSPSSSHLNQSTNKQ